MTAAAQPVAGSAVAESVTEACGTAVEVIDRHVRAFRFVQAGVHGRLTFAAVCYAPDITPPISGRNGSVPAAFVRDNTRSAGRAESSRFSRKTPSEGAAKG